MGLVKEIEEEEEEKWDKIRAWDSVQQDIRSRLNEPEKFDQSMTLNHGPQLFHTLRHASSIKCMTHFTSTIGDNFVTHYRIGTVDHLSLWALESKERDAVSKHNRFTIHSELRCLLYVPQHKVYFGFGTDLVMRVYTDSRSQCQEVGAIPCDTTILCMSYCKDTNEVFAGGIGTLEKWRVKGSEHSAVATRGENFDLELRSDEWVIDVKVDPRNKQLLALTYDGIYVANYQTMKQTHHLQNRHDGSLRCCSFYKQREYFITGGGDGLVKVWNAVVFSQVHIFYGHRDAITALQVHKTDPLLFSSSLDGTVQIWRMDNFCKFMRVDLGDPVYQMKLLGDEEFFCQTEKQIKIYNLNQFYHLYAPVESSVYKLQLCQGSKSHPSRIICSTEDGSVRFFSPTTGATITIIYPMPTFQVLTCFAYCRDKERLMTVLQNGDVLVFNCETNPCKAEEIWQATSHDEEVTSLVLVSLMYEGIKGANIRDSVIFGGLRNGQIALMEAANCVMVKNVQAHEGAITCMEYATEIDGSGFQMMETSKTLVTGGDDSFLKIWNIVIVPGHTGDQISLEVILKIHCKSPPQYVSMYENTLCLTLSRTKESRCCMEMYRLDSSDPGNPGAPLQYTQLHHAADEDHTDQITAVDKCPLLGLFVTSGVDGYIKVWNRHNQLVREMGFGEPLFGLCFANPRGDLLVGYQNHVCLIPLTSFFPHNYLERITLQNFKDESKENVIPYNPRVKPWFDAKKLPKFSTSLSVRTQERNRPEPEEILEDLEAEEEEREEQARRRLNEERTIIEEEILRRLEKRRLDRAFRDSHRPITREETEATSFLGSPTPSEEEALKSPAHTPEGITLRKVGQTTSKAGQITSRGGATTPRTGGVVPKGGALTPRPGTITPRGGGSVFKPGPRGSQEGLITSPDTSIDADFEFDIDTPRSIKKKKTVKFEKKEDKGRRGSGMANLHLLTPFERALLKRKPIIALDGYIPNSVIRKQLGFRPPTPPMMPPSREVWTPKPVPVPKPSHVPGYEEEEPMDLYELAKRFKMYLSDSEEESVYHWSDSDGDVNERPCHGQKRGRGKRKKKQRREIGSDDGWSDDDQSNQVDDDDVDEVDDFIDDLHDESGAEVAESLIGTEFSLLAEGNSLKDQKPFFWGDGGEEPTKTPLQQLKKVTGMVRTISNLSSTSSKRQFKPQSRRSTPGTPGKYELKSRAFQFGEMDFGLGTPDSIRGFRTKSGGPNSRERTKSFNLTNMIVDENSTNVKFKEETGKGKRKVPSDMEVIHKLLKEDFFRDVKGASPSFDSILQRLLTMLDTEDADIHSKVCDYILDLHRDVGISEHYLDRFINKLSHQMNNGAGNLNIRKNGLTALSVIGKSRQDVVASILPRLVDGISELRDEAANALANLTGVTTKDDLFKLMEDMGLQKSYSSKEDEEEALKAIATRLDVPYRSDSFNDWIDGWMADAISPFENAEDLKLQDIDKAWGGREQKWVPESLCLSDATSRASNRLRELSFISDKSLLEEDRLSFLSFQSEPEFDSQYNSSDEDFNNDIENPIITPILQLQIGGQTLNVPPSIGEILADDHPDAIFSQVFDTEDENYAKQMEVIDQILVENPDFDLNDLDLQQEGSIVGLLTPRSAAEKLAQNGGISDFKNGKLSTGNVFLRQSGTICNTTEDVNEKKSKISSQHGVDKATETENGDIRSKWSPQVDEKREKTIIEEEQIKDIEAPPTSRASSRHSKRSSKIRREGYTRRVSFNTKIQDVQNWFDPRDPTLYKYYKKRYAMRPGSGKPRERNGKVPSGSFHKLSSYTEDVDSQYMSQESVDVSSGQVGDGGTDTMSTQDSGIVRDLSASLGSQSSKGIPSNVRFSSHSLMKAGRRSKEWLQSKSRLSPVKSSSSLFQQTPHVSKSLRPDDDWQKFFNTPTAMERRRMEMVKRDFTEGRMRQNVPATIHYISDDLPKLPGEAGLRLLHTVRVGDKNVDGVLEKHRVEPIPGKLSSQTKNENEGESRYGILKMKWTTGIPIPARFLESETVIEGDRDSIIYSETASELSQYPAEFKSHDRGGSQSERSHHHDRHSHQSHDRSRDQQRKKKESKSYDTSSKKSKGKKSLLPQLAEKYANKSNTVNVKSNYSDFWTFPTLPGAVAPSPDFVWEHPIPPPPERESRTNIPYIKTEHERYCKYYNLIKKNLHKYTSENGAPTLPKIEVTRALPSKENKKNAELTRGPSLVFPPITLNQLISAK